MSIRWKYLAYIVSIEIVIFYTFGFTIFEFLYNKLKFKGSEESFFTPLKINIKMFY